MLNAGAGSTVTKRIQPLLTSHEWDEIRLDVDSGVNPDVVGSITDLARLFPAASFDAIWCSHVMEHLYAHEVHPTFVQFRQVLKPDGFALIMSPDLEAVAQHMLTRGLGAIAYVSPAGPIRPLDMIYGHSGAIEQGRHHMAHKTGFSTDGEPAAQRRFPDGVGSEREFRDLCTGTHAGGQGRADQATAGGLRIRLPGDGDRRLVICRC